MVGLASRDLRKNLNFLKASIVMIGVFCFRGYVVFFMKKTLT